MAPRFGDDSRPYHKTHPWISFTFNMTRLDPMDWVRLGEVLSKSDHIANVALPAAVSAHLHQLCLVKGALASAQIEGNTLTEDQAMAQVHGSLSLPPTQEYKAKDFDNIREACEMVTREVRDGRDLRLTPERIKQFNRMVLEGQPIDEDIAPGEVRTRGVAVGSVYAGPPAGDCEYLLAQLCDWLEQLLQDASDEGPEWQRITGLVRAVLAHLYLAWIRPFGDGNGRTARLIEFQLLLAAGFPTPACHLLSNYYNKTRARYYQVLRETSRGDAYPVWRFVSYAVQGFLEELHGQVGFIQQHQLGLAWLNLVGGIRLGVQEATDNRRRSLLLAIPGAGPDFFTPVEGLSRISPDIAAAYAGKHPKTLTRDVNVLLEQGLLVGNDAGDGVRPAWEQLYAFLPIRSLKPTPEEEILASAAALSKPLEPS